MPALESGTVLPLVRVVEGARDPLALYDALSGGGTREGTFLLETREAGATPRGRSLIGLSCALRIACDGHSVSIEARSPNGRSFLPWIAARLEPIAALETSGEGVVARFPIAASAPRDERGRVGAPSPLDVLRAAIFAPRLLDGPWEETYLAAGVLSYDLIDLFETLPRGNPEPHPTPEFEFFVPDRLLVVDHDRRRTLVVAHAFGGQGGEANANDASRAVTRLVAALDAPQRAASPRAEALPPGRRLEPEVDRSDEEFAALVRRLKRHLEAGDVYQLVPSRTFSLACASPLQAFAALRMADPCPYLFHLRLRGETLLGASPETAVQVRGTPRRITVRPIAGTAIRGRRQDESLDPDLDARRETALRLDAKETAEHLMLVDLARSDVARVSRPGTRVVTRLLEVERFAHVMHLVSEVRGELDEELDALDAYVAAMNAGTLVGAPKLRAAQILREVEPTRRGIYGGAVGTLAHGGEMETAITIRSARVRDGVARVRAGAGVVLDSDPDSEALETRSKAAAALRAIAAAEGDHA